jgi:hypothetical protein
MILVLGPIGERMKFIEMWYPRTAKINAQGLMVTEVSHVTIQLE